MTRSDVATVDSHSIPPALSFKEMTAVVESLLEPGALYTAAQPIVCVADGTIAGFELLARAAVPSLLRPDEWLSHASFIGLRTELELACVEAAVSRGAPPDGSRLFVNVSAQALNDPRAGDLLGLLPPHVIEITEHEPIEDYPALRERLRMLFAENTMLAIDDVGSGYSSMSHVLELSPQFIKIDQRLVRNIHLEPNQQAVLKGLVGFARQSGTTTIAEGVESSYELASLRAIGVDLVQGFLIARPGEGWPQPRPVSRQFMPSGDNEDGRRRLSLEKRVQLLVDPKDAAEEITTHLFETHGLHPSVYVEQAGVLRFLAGRGQWQILDGIGPGVGLTGSAFEIGKPVLVQDVTCDMRYREAVPGIVAELAMPLKVSGQVVGVLNVDTSERLDDDEIDAVMSAAGILERAFALTGIMATRSSPLTLVGRQAPRLAAAGAIASLMEEAVAAALVVTRLDAACIWMVRNVGPVLSATCGVRSDALAELGPNELDELLRLVSDVSCSYSTGPVFTRAFGPMGLLRDRGYGTVLAAAVRNLNQISGLLVVVGEASSTIDLEVAEGVELLGRLVGAGAARFDMLTDLKELALRYQQ